MVMNCLTSMKLNTDESIGQVLEENPLDFTKLDRNIQYFISNSSGMGAKTVKTKCTQFREYSTTANADGGKRIFQQLKEEHATLKNKLEAYIQLSRQIGHADKASPPKVRDIN